MEQTVTERISQLRRVVEVHSIIYYKFHNSIVTDAQYDVWCKQLVDLQTEYPEEASQAYKPELFADFTGDTGMHLTEDESRQDLALYLLYRNKST